MSEKQELKKLKLIFYLVLCLLVLFLFSKCFTFSPKFGPYQGKVVDMETGEPIEGAIVFFQFMAVSGSVGGPVYHYGDSLEVFTDEDGKFSVPETRISGVRFNETWEEHARLLVYKPGYWNFPWGQSKIEPSMKRVDKIQNNSFVTIELKKTKYRDEVEKNLSDIMPHGGVPDDKLRNIKKLMNIDKAKIGRPLYKID